MASDGTGDGWPEYPEPEPSPAPRPPEMVQSNVDAAIAAAGGLTPGRDPVSVDVDDLFEDTEGTDGDDYTATSSDPTVATVEITDNPRVVITPVGPGRTTIRVTALESGDGVEFDVMVAESANGAPTPPGNGAPTITNPGNRQYVRGETIAPFPIAVTDPDGDDVTVAVSGLPAGLSWASGQVSGTVAADAAARAHTVTVTANDGVNDPVTATFTITVAANSAPVIVNPGNKEYGRGETITPFSIGVRDADGDTVAVQVTGLPAGLSWSPSPGQVSGTVAADAAARDYTVTVTADDGVNEAVTGDFTIRVVPAWILLADSLAVSRLGGTYTGDGPDGGGWPIRWARWYYAEFEPGWTIVQVYVASPGSWAGAGQVGCQVQTPPPSMVWNAYKSSMTNGAELLGSEAPVRFRDGAGNPTSRVPAGYDDDPARLWTFRFPRTDSTHTRFLTSCQGAAATTGLLHFHNVPLPPSP